MYFGPEFELGGVVASLPVEGCPCVEAFEGDAGEAGCRRMADAVGLRHGVTLTRTPGRQNGSVRDSPATSPVAMPLQTVREGEPVGATRVVHHLVDQLTVELRCAAAVELHEQGPCGADPDGGAAAAGGGHLEHEAFTAAELVHHDDAEVREDTVVDVVAGVLRVDQSSHGASVSFISFEAGPSRNRPAAPNYRTRDVAHICTTAREGFRKGPGVNVSSETLTRTSFLRRVGPLAMMVAPGVPMLEVSDGEIHVRLECQCRLR